MPESVAPTQDLFTRLPNGIRICYRTDGDIAAPAVLLLGGLGEDITAWSQYFVSTIAARGFYIIRMDNRDCGKSTFIDARPPSVLRQLFTRPLAGAYTLADLAADSVGLLDHLDISTAHIVGRSMGGMIAQSIAARFPTRTTSLTSIYSTTGNRKVGQPTISTKLLLTSPPPRTRTQAVRAHLRMMDHLAGTRYPIDEVAEAAHAVRTWDRTAGDASSGIARQVQAIQASGDRTAELRTIRTATLVINGDRDHIVDPTGGTATAAAIHGARHLIIPGMGHHIPDSLADHVISAVTEHLQTSTRNH